MSVDTESKIMLQPGKLFTLRFRELTLLSILFLCFGVGSSLGDVFHITVENWRFDADENNNTQVDTLTISQNDTIQWDWVEGFHTITSGLSSSPDDNPGELFDVPSDPDNTFFQFAYLDEGDFPYFCRPHEGLNMKGLIRVQVVSGIDDESHSGARLPGAFSLSQNYPNPFNPLTTITFQIQALENSPGEKSGVRQVSLDVYDTRGRKVRTLVRDALPPGERSVIWDGRGDSGEVLASGAYFYRLTVDERSVSRKMILAR